MEQIKQAYEQDGHVGLAASVTETGTASRTFRASWRRRSASWSDSPPIRLLRSCLGRPHGQRLSATRTERAEAARVEYREHVDTMRAAEIVIPPIELLDSLAPDELRTVLRSVFQTVRVGRGRARGRGPIG